MEGVLPTSDILHCVLSAAALAGEKGQGGVMETCNDWSVDDWNKCVKHEGRTHTFIYQAAILGLQEEKKQLLSLFLLLT